MPDAARILLVGAGPVGSLLASALAENGVRFDWHVRSAKRRSELESGLRVAIDAEEMTFSQNAYRLMSDTDERSRGYYIVIIAVRAGDVEHARAQFAELVKAEQTLVVANGLQQGPFQLGLLYGGARLDVGVLVSARTNRMVVGPLRLEPSAVPELVEQIRCEWLQPSWEADIEAMMWHKLCLNCVVNPLSALLGCPNGELLRFIDAPLVAETLRECLQVAAAVLGQRWTFGGETALTNALMVLLKDTAENTSSMLRDVQLGRVTEIGMLNVAVAALGRRFDLPCPFNEALSASIIALANKPRL